MIQTDEQLHRAEKDVQTLWRFLEQAKQAHGASDYERLATPYLLQIQQRQQDILTYLSIKSEALSA